MEKQAVKSLPTETKEIKVNNTTFIVKDKNTPSIKLIAEAVINLSRSI